MVKINTSLKKSCLFIFPFLLALFLIGCAATSTFDTKMDEGREALKNKDYDTAINAFSVALEEKPDDKKAVKLKEKAEDKKLSAEIKSKLSKAKDLLIDEEFEEVVSISNDILEKDSKNKKAKNLKKHAENKIIENKTKQDLENAEQAMENKEYSIAITSYESLLKIDPDNTKVKELKHTAETKLEKEKKLKEEQAKKAEEVRVAKQKENERKAAEVKAKKQAEKRASASQNSSSSSSNSNKGTNGQVSESQSECNIKGSVNHIYHVPGSTYYNRTKNVVQWFCSPAEAEAAGFRAPQR